MCICRSIHTYIHTYIYIYIYVILSYVYRNIHIMYTIDYICLTIVLRMYIIHVCIYSHHIYMFLYIYICIHLFRIDKLQSFTTPQLSGLLINSYPNPISMIPVTSRHRNDFGNDQIHPQTLVEKCYKLIYPLVN